MQGWEYKTLASPVKSGAFDPEALDDVLNRLGADGWELVTVSSVQRGGETVSLVHHLRRHGEPARRIGFHA
ncbi:MAG TPA: DUF4177 domain-containing protein [Candidatus Hydrogenedentes bacterium]|nr:DUF4177 domain-containing protein [Candidatus Hydrogenedentota bacterium]